MPQSQLSAAKDFREGSDSWATIINLSTVAVEMFRDLRAELDAIGGFARRLLAVLDGSLCSRTVFGAPIDRVDPVARCRKEQTPQ